jgi:hypothetical protein
VAATVEDKLWAALVEVVDIISVSVVVLEGGAWVSGKLLSGVVVLVLEEEVLSGGIIVGGGTCDWGGSGCWELLVDVVGGTRGGTYIFGWEVDVDSEVSDVLVLDEGVGGT